MPSPPSRILIVRLSAIGDCVMASPVPNALRQTFPNAQIVWAVGEKSRAVVEGLESVDEVLIWKKGMKGFFQIMREVRRRRFEVVLELQGRPKSTLLMALSGAKRRLVSPRFGFLSRFFSTQLVEHPPGYIYPPLRYICWAQALGAPAVEPAMSVPIGSEDRNAAKHLLGDESAIWVAFNPGCSATNRKWDIEKFAATAKAVVEEHPEVKVVICGGPQDISDAGAIAAALPANRFVNAAGKVNLRATAALLESCSAVVTNDTGPMHMAVAVKAPVVGVFGPVQASRRLPSGNFNVGVEHNEECRLPNRPKCSKGGACACLQSISSSEVASAVSNVLARRETQQVVEKVD